MTFADADEVYTMDQTMKFLEELFSFLPDEIQCPQENMVFLFHGKGTEITKSAEL